MLPLEARKSNSHSILIKMPKIILLVRLCPFLEYRDIVELSSVSTVLRRTVFGPIGWKLLSRISSPYPLLFRQLSDDCRFDAQQVHDVEPFHEAPPEDEKNLRKARLEGKKELMQLYEKYRAKEE